MARRKSIRQTETKEVVLDLINLGFSVDAVAYMLKKTPPNIYAHVKSAGQMANRRVIRMPLTAISQHAKGKIMNLFPDSPWMTSLLLSVAQAATHSPAIIPASAAKRGYRKSGKRKKGA